MITSRRLPCFSLKHWLVGALAGLSAAFAVATPAGLPVVTDGRPAAVVVTPERPHAVVVYAAQELVRHVEQATGAKLTVVTEDKVPAGTRAAIYLGDTRAARSAGINAAQLPPETFVLRLGKDALFITGHDGKGDPLDNNTVAGTLFGVYEWLERDLGVRWVWPGELGAHIPKASAVAATPVDLTVTPKFFQRNIRPGTGFGGKLKNPALGFTPKAAADYAQEQAVFLRRHRMGRGHRVNYRHAFTDWQEKYGEAHPDWFQLVNGKRGPVRPGGRYSMCVSNPEFHREIVAQWKAKGGHKASPSYLNVVENDILGLCECDKCRAWDGPEPADYMTFIPESSKIHGYRFVSDRYARFALEVQKLAAKENPDVIVIGYLYQNYFQAPTSGIKLNPNILLGFCPSTGWYPRAPAEQDWYKKQWQTWRDTGARLFVRTNYFLDGYNMPFIFGRQFADDFQHQARNGMVATDFDSLTGHWGTQGPNLYLLMRLHTKPDADAEALLAEYYSAFGPAAAAVKEYFDHWERYTTDHQPAAMKAFDYKEAGRWRAWARATHLIFPEECFAPGETLLAKAAAAAAGNPQAEARVEFLKKGLAHAKLTSRVSRLLTTLDAEATPERGKDALMELLAFRRAHEREWIGNFNHLAWVEDASWKLPNETKLDPEMYP